MPLHEENECSEREGGGLWRPEHHQNQFWGGFKMLKGDCSIR